MKPIYHYDDRGGLIGVSNCIVTDTLSRDMLIRRENTLTLVERYLDHNEYIDRAELAALIGHTLPPPKKTETTQWLGSDPVTRELPNDGDIRE